MTYEVASSELFDALTAAEHRRCLYVDDHPSLQRRWIVNCDDPTYRLKLEDVLGPYLDVMPLALPSLLAAAEDWGYRVVFLNDPAPVLAWVESLSRPVGVKLKSSFPDTIDGLLPFQVQAVNFCKDLRGSVLNASTGTGKSPMSIALTEWHRQQGNFDLCLHVIKKHNKINVRRAFKRFLDLGTLLTGVAKANRTKAYAQTEAQVQAGEQPVLIINYENFKTDTEALKKLVTGRKVFIVFDEMPTKLKNRGTALYRRTAEVFYTARAGDVYYPRKGYDRCSEFRGMMLSATPIENSPMDFFNCVHMLDPTVYGSAERFESEFTVGKDEWDKPIWINQKLPQIGRKAAHMVYRIDKSDPDIASQFPEVAPPETMLLEMHPKDRKLYDVLADEYRNMKFGDFSMLDMDDVLATVNVLQMIASSSRAARISAERFHNYELALQQFIRENDPTVYEVSEFKKRKRVGSEVARKLWRKVGAEAFDDMDGKSIRAVKVRALKELLETGEKAVVFTRMNDTVIPRLSEFFDQWGIEHVCYHGGMTAKAKQAAQDEFKGNPSCQVFLSSDAGSDSIDLEESAFVIHFDLPFTWAKLVQRQNRVHRITSSHAVVRYVMLVVENTVEARWLELLDLKEFYDAAIMRGEIAHQSQSLRQDLYYLLCDDENMAA